MRERTDSASQGRPGPELFGVDSSPGSRARRLTRYVDQASVPASSAHPIEAKSPAGSPYATAPLDAPAAPCAALLEKAKEATERFGAFLSINYGIRLADGEADPNTQPLAGLAVAVKDNISVAGLPLTAGSDVLRGNVATQDAAVVARLSQLGASVLGKAALDEFAFGTLGPGISNPAAAGRTVGGSSGGSAAAVAAGACSVALGTDTGGSVRIPASCTATVGFKPTTGWFSTRGVVPLSWSLDVVGLITATVDQAASVYGALVGDPAENTAAEVVGLRIGVPDEPFLRVADSSVRTEFEATCARLAAAGATLLPVGLPDSDVALDLQYLIVLAEAANYHALQWDDASPYSDSVRAALGSGRQISAADYLTAQRARSEVRRLIEASTAGCDVLALPTLPIDPPQVGTEAVTLADGRSEDAVSTMLRFTALFNHAGNPAISIPLITADGIPRGLQLACARGADGRLLKIARAIEQLLAA